MENLSKPVEVPNVGRRWVVMLAAPLLAWAPLAFFGGAASAHTDRFDCTRGTSDHHADTDADGLCDDEETFYGTDPTVRDTDGDGLWDGNEVILVKTNPLNPDTDGDTLTDGQEVETYNTDPKKVDTDGDGLGDGPEVKQYKTDPNDPDTDGDLFSDKTEVNNGSDPRNPLSVPIRVDGVQSPKSPVGQLPVTDDQDPIL
ncbi:MAG TPA: hypothetical protein VMY34_06415 [Acidimicrobiales bacterium]|nr:hypothetical protein [Acidimicrobiales bacterium]